MNKLPFELKVIPYGKTSFVRLEPGGWMMHYTFMETGDKLYNIKPRPDDVWLISHPKTGTTWASELVWTIQNNGDVETAGNTPQFDRLLFPEFDFFTKPFYESLNKDELDEKAIAEFSRDRLQETIDAPSPRVIKTHMPLCVLPHKLHETSKVIYVCRNPLDTCVSWYHFSKTMTTTKLELDLDAFAGMFIRGLLPFGPYWQHVKIAWELRDHPNFLFLTYEEMKHDIYGVIKKVSDFLGKPLTAEQMTKVANYLSIDSMKNNKMVNMDIYKDYGMYKKDSSFFRKGVVGDFKNNLSPELEQKIKKCWNDSMGDSGLTFQGVDLTC